MGRGCRVLVVRPNFSGTFGSASDACVASCALTLETRRLLPWSARRGFSLIAGDACAQYTQRPSFEKTRCIGSVAVRILTDRGLLAPAPARMSTMRRPPLSPMAAVLPSGETASGGMTDGWLMLSSSVSSLLLP